MNGGLTTFSPVEVVGDVIDSCCFPCLTQSLDVSTPMVSSVFKMFQIVVLSLPSSLISQSYGRKSDLCDFNSGMVVGARCTSLSISETPTILHTNHSLEFTQNDNKNEKQDMTVLWKHSDDKGVSDG